MSKNTKTQNNFIRKILSIFVPSRSLRNRIKMLLDWPYGIKDFIKREKQLLKNPQQNFPCFLSVVAIVRNEAPNFKEWIEYHKIIGVDKFYIYDNESNDNTLEILQPYIDDGTVEYIYFPGEKMQIPAYKHFIENFSNDTKWAATIDLDEFIVSKSEPIKSFLQKQPKNTTQILIPWVFFGSNGHIKKPKGLVIENYTKRAKKAKMFKSIFRPNMTLDVHVHKHFVAGKTIFPKMDKIMLNHYYCKSWEEYKKRATRGDVFRGKEFAKKTFNKEKFNQNDKNEITDTFILQYVDKVKEKI